MSKFLWYLTLTSAIWLAFFGSFSTVVGEIYPFQVLVLLSSVVTIMSKTKIKITIEMKFSIILFLAMLFYGIVSLFWVYDLSFGIKKLTHYFIGVLFLIQFFIMNNNFDELKTSVKVFNINYYFLLLVSIYEIFTGVYFHATHYIQTYHTNDFNLHFPLAMYNNTNDLALFLLLFFPIVNFGIYLNDHLTKTKAIVTYTIVTFIIFNSESRLASTFILLYGFMLLLYRMLYAIRNKNLKSSIYFFIISVLIIFVLIEKNIFSNVIESIINDPRLTIYITAFNSFLETLTLGVGIGNLYYVTELNIHNYILEILIEFGLIIFIPYLLWLAFLFKRLNAININLYPVSLLIFSLKVSILFLPVWGGLSSTLTSKPFIWIFYSFIVVSLSVFTKSKLKY